MTVESIRRRFLSEKRIVLSVGGHDNPQEGLCAMEAVAWLAGLPHSSQPQCTSPVIAAYVRNLNDFMPNVARQALIPFLRQLIGTKAPDLEKARGTFFAWQAVKVFAPAALNVNGSNPHTSLLQEAQNLSEAKRAAGLIYDDFFYAYRDPPSAALAVQQAERSAGSISSLEPRENAAHCLREDLAYRVCGNSTAEAAYHAHRAGCDNAWNLALMALDVAICMQSRRPAEYAEAA